MSRDYDRRSVLKGLGVAGMTGLAGCTGDGGGGGGGGGGSDSRSSAIKYGVLLPLTGDLASVGKPMRDAAVLPGKQLDSADTGDLTFDWQVEDTQTNPSSGISAANSLVNAGYPGVCGPASSGVNIQVSKQVFIPNEVVGCSPSSTAPSVTDLEDDGYIFRTAPSDALQGQVMAQVANENLGSSTAATLYVNNDYGQLLSEAFVEGFKNVDGTVQTQTAFEKQQSSYTSKLSEALSDDPDLLVVIGYPASGVQLFKDYYADFSGETDIMVTDGLQDPGMQKQVGNPMDNVVGTAPQPSGPSADAFRSAYMDEYDREPGIFNAHSYDASAVLVLANAMAGENTGSAVRDNMREVANPDGTAIGPDNIVEGVQMAAEGENVMYEGASSPVEFNEPGDMQAVTYSVWEFAPDTESGIEVVNTIDFTA